jgi:hypothetical protein
MRAISTVVAMGLAVVGAACYNIKTVTFETFGTDRVNQVWVTRADQSVVFMKDAEIYRDKLRGFVDREMQELSASDLQQIKVRQLNKGKTAALIGGALVAGVAVAWYFSGTNNDYIDGCAGLDDCGDDNR